MHFQHTSGVAFVLSMGLSLCGGCTQQTGLGRYALSGAVVMPDGTPAHAGEISFEPDGASGNKGPGSMTQIKGGKYSLPKDQGIVGGKYVVTILPFDRIPLAESAQGKPLRKAPYSERLDLPAKDSTHDFKMAK
jgi:hypothetical protein